MIQKKPVEVKPGKISKHEVINYVAPDAPQFLEVNFDYFRGSAKGLSESEFREIYLDVIGTDPAEVIKDSNFGDYRGDKKYQNMAKAAHSQKVLWGFKEGKYAVRVELPGQYCSSCTTLASLTRKVEKWKEMGLIPSRTDIALTDHQKRIPWEIWEEVYENQSARHYSNYELIRSSKGTDSRGETLYIGSRESDRFHRIYETTVKHGFPANRIETVFHGRECQKLWQECIQQYNNREREKGFKMSWKEVDEYINNYLASWSSKVCIGRLDFIDRSEKLSSGSLEKCSTLPWWKEFTQDVGGQVKLFVEKHTTSIARKVKWLKRQVSKLLAILKRALSPKEFDYIMNMLFSHGEKKITHHDNIALGELYEQGIAIVNELHDWVIDSS